MTIDLDLWHKDNSKTDNHQIPDRKTGAAHELLALLGAAFVPKAEARPQNYRRNHEVLAAPKDSNRRKAEPRPEANTSWIVNPRRGSTPFLQ